MTVTPSLQAVAKHFDPRQFLTHPVELITYQVDAGFDRGNPDGVFLPESTADVVKLVNLMRQRGLPMIARGAGTGLSGGAVAEHGGVIVNFARMNRILTFDPQGRTARVEPGVVNLKFDALVKEQGLYYPPDPSSQRSSVIGGNVGMNSGGPHCFKYGVTTNYVTGLEVVLADGTILRTGGQAFDPPEIDFTGLLVGNEGTLAIVTSVDLRLIRNPPGVKTMMVSFRSDEEAGAAVSAIIAAGLTPATLEMMDQKIMRIIEDYAHCGLPVEAQSGLIVEVDGYPESLDTQMEEMADLLHEHGGYDLRIAGSEAERQQIWYGRKSAAGAMSRLAPAFYIVDVTVPRSRLAEMLAEVNAVCDKFQVRNGHVFHAGDGNLHPTLLCDPRDADLMKRVFAACDEIVELCLAKDGSITGEHGVGIEKRKFMPAMFTPSELSAMLDIKAIFDPHNLFNPGKIFPPNLPPADYATPNLPGGDIFAPQTTQAAAAGLAALSETKRPVHITSRTSPGAHGALQLSTHHLTGIHKFAPSDLYITVGAGTLLSEVQAFLIEHKMQLPLVSPWSATTIGGLVAGNHNSPQRLRYGSIRDNLLCTTVALADGRVMRAGRPVVKNVAGYDLTKLFVGSEGQLGLMTDLTLKLTPVPRAQRTLRAKMTDMVQGLTLGQQLSQQMLICSGLVLVDGQLFYTAEGMPEDVDAELAQVAKRDGAWEQGAQNGVQVWAQFLGETGGEELVVRIGLPPSAALRYWQALDAALQQETRWLVDIASGLFYARFAPGDLAAAQAWLAAVRAAAVVLAGYALVIQAPAGMGDGIEVRGEAPGSAALLRKLKERWDPAGILA